MSCEILQVFRLHGIKMGFLFALFLVWARIAKLGTLFILGVPHTDMLENCVLSTLT